MAGVGRRTLYRKSVTDDYLNSTPEPGENEEIALAQAPRGSNIIEVGFLIGQCVPKCACIVVTAVRTQP